MSTLLRMEMILIALVMLVIVIRSVNRKKMRIQYSLVWVTISAALLIIALFPGIVFSMCAFLDIQTPSNLIYLMGILALLLVTFSQTIIISKQSDQIKFLIQTISLENYQKKMEEHDEDPAN